MNSSSVSSAIKIIILSFIVFFTQSAAEGSVRTEPAEIKVVWFQVEFNGEPIKAGYSIVDARTADEKEADRKNGRLAGAAIIFFHGHGQRPDSGGNFITGLAMKSRSGVIVTPVCDTPYGSNEKWRGDAGKIVILLEIVRRALAGEGIVIDGCSPASDLEINIDGKKSAPEVSAPPVSARLLVLGYSHGAILSRRFANSYPSSVDSMVHVCPAGYTEWGTAGTCCLISNFGLEMANIGLRFFSYPGAVADSGCGVTKGISGDFFRSCPSCLYGNMSCFKLFRPLRDVKDCTLRVDDRKYPVMRVKNITVIFAYDDLLFDADEILGVDDPKKITLQDEERFWSKYYTQEVLAGAKFTLRILPGTHNGPIEHCEEYTEAALSYSGELRDVNK